MSINKEDLKKYSREDLESIVINTAKVIDRFNIVPDFMNNTFQFDLSGKRRDARTLVDAWDMIDSRSICDFCDYKINAYKPNSEKI